MSQHNIETTQSLIFTLTAAREQLASVQRAFAEAAPAQAAVWELTSESADKVLAEAIAAGQAMASRLEAHPDPAADRMGERLAGAVRAWFGPRVHQQLQQMLDQGARHVGLLLMTLAAEGGEQLVGITTGGSVVAIHHNAITKPRGAVVHY